MMIMSFFEVVDVLPYVQSFDLIVNGHQIELSEQQQTTLQEGVQELFENSLTMPAFAVTFDEIFKEEIQDGTFVLMKFDRVFKVNELPFDELVFKVQPDFQGFNLYRGMRGIFQGRCIYIDLNGKDMQALADCVKALIPVNEGVEQGVNNIDNGIENDTENGEKQNDDDTTNDENVTDDKLNEEQNVVFNNPENTENLPK